MKIRKIDPNAVTSTESSGKLVSLTEADLVGVAGAGCWMSANGEFGPIDVYHGSYEERETDHLV